MWPLATVGRWRRRSVPKSMRVTFTPPSAPRPTRTFSSLRSPWTMRALWSAASGSRMAGSVAFSSLTCDGPGARESRRQRLRVDVHVADPVGAVGLAGVDALGQPGVVDARDEAVGREQALDRALVAAGLALEDLEDPLLVAAPGEVHRRELALAELLHHEELAERLALGDLLAAEEAPDVADAGVDPLARDEDDVDERVDAVAVEAALGQRAGEARLGVGAAHLSGVEPEQALAHRGHLVEREEALELGAENVDRRIHGRVHPGRRKAADGSQCPRCGSTRNPAGRLGFRLSGASQPRGSASGFARVSGEHKKEPPRAAGRGTVPCLPRRGGCSFRGSGHWKVPVPQMSAVNPRTPLAGTAMGVVESSIESRKATSWATC